MDIDEELIDYQEDDEMMALDGTKPPSIVQPPAAGEDAEMVEADGTGASGSGSGTGTGVVEEDDEAMKVEEDGKAKEGDDALMRVNTNEGVGGDEVMVDEDVEVDGMTGPTETTETTLPTTTGQIASEPITTDISAPLSVSNPTALTTTPAITTALINNPTIPPPGMIITGADTGLAATSIVPSWPPPPDAIPPVPSRLPDAVSVPVEMASEESKLPIEVGGEVESGKDVEVTSVRAEAMGSPPIEAGELAPMDDDEEPKLGAAAKPIVKEMIIKEGESTTPAGEMNMAEASGSAGHHEGEEYVDESAEHVEGEETGEDYVEEEEYYEEDGVNGAIGEGDAIHDEERDSEPLGAETVAELDDGNANEVDLENMNNDHDEADLSDESSAGPPAIMIAFNETDHRPLFERIPKSSTEAAMAVHTDESDLPEPLLPNMGDELYKVPLSELFVALRLALKDTMDEEKGNEMVLFEKDLGLRVGEDNRHTNTLTLCNIVELHQRCNCPEPITLFIEHDSSRFISKYNAIKNVLDEAEGKADAYTEAEGDDLDHEDGVADGEELDEYAEEHVGDEYEDGEVYEEDGETHAEGMEDRAADPAPAVDSQHVAETIDGEQTVQEKIEEGVDSLAAEENHVADIDPNDAGIETSGVQEAPAAETDADAADETAEDAIGGSHDEADAGGGFGIDDIIRGAENHAESNGVGQPKVAETTLAIPADAEELIEYDEETGTRTPSKDQSRTPSGTKRALEEPDSPSRQVKRKLSGEEES